MSEDEYFMEADADMMVGELRAFIDAENRLVQEEHELNNKLQSWDAIFMHLDERLPLDATYIHDLNGKITDKLNEIRDVIESENYKDLKFVSEEKKFLEHFREDVAHRKWRIVKRDLSIETNDEHKVLRLEEQELKNLHYLFAATMNLMKRSSLLHALNEDFAIAKEKEQYAKLEEYYFLQVYKFVSSYEQIFRHLWAKEKHLAEKIKHDSKKLR